MKRELRRQAGFSTVMAVAVLVLMTVLAGALVRLSVTEQSGANLDLLQVRAGGALRAGNEWGLYQVLQLNAAGFPGNCAVGAASGKGTTLDVRADTGFWVTVRCSANSVTDVDLNGNVGPVTLYLIDAVACNLTDAATGCPNAAQAASPAYVERRRQVMVSGN